MDAHTIKKRMVGCLVGRNSLGYPVLWVNAGGETDPGRSQRPFTSCSGFVASEDSFPSSWCLSVVHPLQRLYRKRPLSRGKDKNRSDSSSCSLLSTRTASVNQAIAYRDRARRGEVHPIINLALNHITHITASFMIRQLVVKSKFLFIRGTLVPVAVCI